MILDSLGLLFREAHPLLEDLPARSRERASDDGGGGFDGFREISVRTELSTRVLRPQLSLVRPCIQDFVAS